MFPPNLPEFLHTGGDDEDAVAPEQEIDCVAD